MTKKLCDFTNDERLKRNEEFLIALKRCAAEEKKFFLFSPDCFKGIMQNYSKFTSCLDTDNYESILFIHPCSDDLPETLELTLLLRNVFGLFTNYFSDYIPDDGDDEEKTDITDSDLKVTFKNCSAILQIRGGLVFEPHPEDPKKRFITIAFEIIDDKETA
jgi:hypothetical protein